MPDAPASSFDVHAPSLRPRPAAAERTGPPPQRRGVWAIVALATVTLVASACSEGAEGDKTAYVLGVEMAELHTEALEAAAALMEGRPDPQELRPQMAALYLAYEARFVSLGKEREGLIAADQYVADRAFRRGLLARGDREYDRLHGHWKHYRQVDPPLADLVMAVNMLMETPNFALLRKARPADAKRLGLL